MYGHVKDRRWPGKPGRKNRVEALGRQDSMVYRNTAVSPQDSEVSVSGRGRGNVKYDREVRDTQDYQAYFLNGIREIKIQLKCKTQWVD